VADSRRGVIEAPEGSAPAPFCSTSHVSASAKFVLSASDALHFHKAIADALETKPELIAHARELVPAACPDPSRRSDGTRFWICRSTKFAQRGTATAASIAASASVL
jgi:hypothetical protein